MVTDGQVYIEVNPLLAYQQPAPAGLERQPLFAPPAWKGDWTGQEKAMFEPLENDSENTKKDPLRRESLSWLGMRDSNPRMPGPKPGALPLGESPLLNCVLFAFSDVPLRSF